MRLPRRFSERVVKIEYKTYDWGPTIVKFGCNGFPVAVPVGLFPQQVLHKSQSADERLDQLSLLQTLVTFDRIDLALTRFGSGTDLYSDKVSCGRECPGAPASWCSPHAPRLRAERFPCQAVALHRYSWRSLPACCPWRATFRRELEGDYFRNPLAPLKRELSSSFKGSSSASSLRTFALSLACTSGDTKRFWYCCCGLSQRV